MRDVLEFWIQLRPHHETEITFKLIPKILMSEECIHFLGPFFGPSVYTKRGIVRQIGYLQE
jgi:hypothetical protein